VLIDRLRARLGDPRAASFQLAGEDLALLDAEDIRAAADAHASALAAIPAELRGDLVDEERALAAESHAWLRRHNRSVHARIAGYVALARRCELRYPWPIVAVLGIHQVSTAIERNRLVGIAGRVRPKLSRLADASEDVLRRTNRGIFADSVPTVLRALRGEELARAGRRDLATALVTGAIAPWWDEQSRALCSAIAGGLALDDEPARFAALARTTHDHFAREQAIFTFHMGAGKRPAPAREVTGPTIARGRLVFRARPLPLGFDMRDHDARVREFGRAFVTAVTSSIDDYRIAARWVLDRHA
jgi:hypothetical protein